MAEELQKLQQAISQLRDHSLPRVYDQLDIMRNDFKDTLKISSDNFKGGLKRINDNFEKILDLLENLKIWKAEVNLKIEPLYGLETKHAIVAGKVDTMSKVLWGIGGLLLTGLAGFGSWIFSKVVEGK